MKIWKLILGFFGLVGGLFAAGAVKSKEVKEVPKRESRSLSPKKKPIKSHSISPIKRKSVAVQDQIKSGKSQQNDEISDKEVYGGLDASKSLLLHGLESDFIEDQMSEDRDFRSESYPWQLSMQCSFSEKRFLSKR